jgi:hypothetical protein
MFELLEISRNQDFYDRIFPIVLDSAKIFDNKERSDYIKLWEQKIENIESKIKNISENENLLPLWYELNICSNVKHLIENFLELLIAMNIFKLNEKTTQSESYSTLIESIYNKIEEDSKNF